MTCSGERSCVPAIGAGACSVGIGAACRGEAAEGPARASGYVEATEVRVAPEVGGRVVELEVEEGDRVAAGASSRGSIPRTTDPDRRNAEAERDQAVAQLRLLQAGARAEDIRQARAQADRPGRRRRPPRPSSRPPAPTWSASRRCSQANAGSRKQRDDAATRREVAAARVKAARERARAAGEALARLRAGARPEEIAAARARVAAADAQIAALDKSIGRRRPEVAGRGDRDREAGRAGEMAAPRTPLVVVTDLDRAWANVYVDEPIVPRLRLGQKATLLTDAGQRLEGTITFISPRAEFTPRNVQTAEERSRLVYRIKVSVDNREGVLKPGMPVEAEMPR